MPPKGVAILLRRLKHQRNRISFSLKPVTFAYICTNGTKAEGTAKVKDTEKCSACETGFAQNADMQCATDSDGTADNVDAFPFDDTRTAGVCGELSPSVVLESGSESEQMTKRTANDATGEVYVTRDARIIASGSGHRDDPFIIPLSQMVADPLTLCGTSRASVYQIP